MKIPKYTVLDMHGYYAIEKYVSDKDQREMLLEIYYNKDEAYKTCAELNEEELLD